MGQRERVGEREREIQVRSGLLSEFVRVERERGRNMDCNVQGEMEGDGEGKGEGE